MESRDAYLNINEEIEFQNVLLFLTLLSTQVPEHMDRLRTC